MLATAAVVVSSMPPFLLCTTRLLSISTNLSLSRLAKQQPGPSSRGQLKFHDQMLGIPPLFDVFFFFFFPYTAKLAYDCFS